MPAKRSGPSGPISAITHNFTSVAPGSVAAQDLVAQTVAVPGAKVGDGCLFTCSAVSGLIQLRGWVSAVDTVVLNWINVSAAPIVLGAVAVRCDLFR